MLTQLFLLILGFFILQKCANWLIDGTLVIGKRFRLSEIFLGLTIVAVGTSLPEIAVNILATAKGLVGIPVANVLGSNIANILVVVGITAIILPVSVKSNTIRIGIPLTLLATLIVALLAQEAIPFISGPNEISRPEGALLAIGFSLYAFYVYAQWGKDVEPPEIGVPRKLAVGIAALLAGIVGLGVSADLIVNSAGKLTDILGISQGLMGSTIIALGTSLPELAASVAAAKRGKPNLLIGNIVGSNMINLLLVLGISAIIAPLPFNGLQLENLIITGIVTILLWFVLVTQLKRPAVKKIHGVGFVLIYLAYLAYMVWRG
jgi:cation:H+ antiporter